VPLDADVAIWLGELVGKAVVELEHSPGMTIEADDRPDYWLQILPEASEHDGQLEGFVLNFPYRGHTGDPVETLRQRGLTPPPGTETREWEDNAFAMIWIRPDVPLVGLAHFAGDILQVIVGAARSAELSVQFDYGY